MTNYDAYDLVDYIACLRNKPDHPKTLFGSCYWSTWQ